MINNSDNKDNNEPEDDLYYFETDHLALKGNKDYNEVIKTLFILCAQRKRAIEDYKKAVELKKEALEDPTKILDKIVNGESLGMPDNLRIPELPVIDWSKYSVKVPEASLKQIYSETNTEVKKKHESPLPKKESKSFLGKWTFEEQKRLEELLQIYPPEAIEMRRFKKIADALGNRTVQQVTSRLQKYFLKLYKAGLPVPGRIPKSAERFRKSSSHKYYQRCNQYLWKPSTFFPDLYVPVTPNSDDLDGTPGPSLHHIKPPSAEEYLQPSTSNYLMPTPYIEQEKVSQKTDTELQLDLVRRIKEEKSKNIDGGTPFRHLNFKCDYCNEEPMVGVRWHCVNCQADSIDFCTDCVLAQMYSENPHPIKHELIAYRDDQMDLSDSDSNAGSPYGSTKNINSDFDENYQSDEHNDPELSNDCDTLKNGVTEFKVQIKSENKNEDLENSADLYNCGDDLNTELFSEIDGGPFDYYYLSN